MSTDRYLDLKKKQQQLNNGSKRMFSKVWDEITNPFPN